MRPLRILLVDAFQDFAEMMTIILREEGHTVRAARDVKTAREACQTFRPDVVLVDPAIAAADPTGFIKTLRPMLDPRARVVALIREGEADEGIDELVDAKLRKPFSVQALLDLFTSWHLPN